MTIKNFQVNGNAMPLKKFDLSRLRETHGGPPSIVMIAKRGSGKSVVCKNILSYFQDIPGGAIIAPSDEASPYYAKFFPNLYIHHKFTHDKLERFWNRQKMIKRKKELYLKKRKRIDSRCFLLMDDCLASKGSWMKDEAILKVFFNGRHYDMMYILTMQFPLGISPELRSNFDYIFLLGDDYYSNQKRLFDHYAGMFPTFQAFRDVFVEVTKNFGCLVIVNRGNRENLFDKVFWFRADPSLKIKKIGCDQFNFINDENFNPEYEAEGFNLDNFGKKKNQKTLKVNQLDD
jgi:hypothetical protein